MAFFITQDCIGCELCKHICPAGAITGEKKAPHCIMADNCIDCGACGRICPSKAVEDDFGIRVEPVKKKKWPRPRFDEKLCMSCGICVDACPAGVIICAINNNKNPHPYPRLASEKDCLGCGFCGRECPVEAIFMVQPQQN